MDEVRTILLKEVRIMTQQVRTGTPTPVNFANLRRTVIELEFNTEILDIKGALAKDF